MLQGRAKSVAHLNDWCATLLELNSAAPEREQVEPENSGKAATFAAHSCGFLPSARKFGGMRQPLRVSYCS